MTELRKSRFDCELDGTREPFLRDMLIIGLNDKKLQERLLRGSNLDLNKTVEICRIVGVTRSQRHVSQNNSGFNPDYNVDEIRRQFSNDQKSQKESPELIKKCKFCSFSHVQHMENFAITVKRKIIFQNALTSTKLTMLKNIRIVPNLLKIAKFLKMKLYL